MDHIKQRSRPEEQAISTNYLNELKLEHDDYFLQKQKSTVKIIKSYKLKDIVNIVKSIDVDIKMVINNNIN